MPRHFLLVALVRNAPAKRVNVTSVMPAIVISVLKGLWRAGLRLISDLMNASSFGGIFFAKFCLFVHQSTRLTLSGLSITHIGIGGVRRYIPVAAQTWKNGKIVHEHFEYGS
jgi:hypothetical protein